MTTLQSQVDGICEQAIDMGLELRELVRMLKRAYILAEIRRSGGNLSKAAKAMGMHRNTLGRDMQVLNIKPSGTRWNQRKEAGAA